MILKAAYDFLKRLKSRTNDESNGRHLIPALVAGLCPSATPAVLDVGAGYGSDLLAVRRAHPKATLFAVEGYPAAVAYLQSNDVNVTSLNLEREALPFPDSTFDVVMCNQVCEHVKELFWVTSELARVCKVDGHLLIGVPNLGSLHNRMALLFGYQPPAIHVFGPHVRGFTNRGLRDFLEEGKVLKVESIVGGNFYPFPPAVSRPLARFLPSMAVSSFLSIRKLNATSFLNVLSSARSGELVDTPYFRGGSAV